MNHIGKRVSFERGGGAEILHIYESTLYFKILLQERGPEGDKRQSMMDELRPACERHPHAVRWNELDAVFAVVVSDYDLDCYFLERWPESAIARKLGELFDCEVDIWAEGSGTG